MSENSSPSNLNKKRVRGRNSKPKTHFKKAKPISNNIKLKHKTKLKVPQIDIIKPKIIENKFSYTTPHMNQFNFSEKTYPDEESDFKKEDSYQENSLGTLTKNFINYIKKTGRKAININDLVKVLSVKKRRIYDITNVLQGMGYIQKSGKNEILWIKKVNKKMRKKNEINKKNISNSKPKVNIEELEKKKIDLDNDIEKYKAEFNTIAQKKDFTKYGYTTLEDLRKLSINEKVDLFIIKATKGTVMNIVDKNDIKKAHDFAKNLIQSGEMDSNELLLNILNKNNQLSFSCPENIGINIYEASNGEIKQIKPNKKVNNIFNNKIPKLLNNNNINNNFLDMNNKNNYMINQNQKAPTFNAFNIQNNITNNVIYNANNFDKKFSSNFTSDRGNLETVQHNVMVNNEEKNIGISYASQSKQQNFGQLINNNIININNNNHPNMNNTLKNQIIINN
jgi:transcription factor E2F3